MSASSITCCNAANSPQQPQQHLKSPEPQTPHVGRPCRPLHKWSQVNFDHSGYAYVLDHWWIHQVTSTRFYPISTHACMCEHMSTCCHQEPAHATTALSVYGPAVHQRSTACASCQHSMQVYSPHATWSTITAAPHPLLPRVLCPGTALPPK